MIDNLALYRYFYETALAGSISAAAKKLYVTQPAVSSMIGNLEKELNTTLFFRTSRGITLTPEGAMLFDYVKNAFAFLEAGEDKLRDISNLSGGVLRIGASDMTLRFFLLDHIQGFHHTFPGVHLTVTNAPTPQTLAALKGGSLDLGVVSGPLDEDDAFEHVKVRRIEDIFVAAPGTVSAKGALSYEQLAEYPLIMLEKDTSTRRYVDHHIKEHCDPARLPVPTIELATSDLVLEFAKRGIGIGSVVKDFAKEALDSRALVQVNLKSPPPPRAFYLVYLKNIALSSAARHFIKAVSAQKDAPPPKKNG
ncbi:MAG: LysR family transcriptional regulator [Clostridia bacterium]|nr:LysR family transcriptional regulator [Clostridia bacterium]